MTEETSSIKNTEINDEGDNEENNTHVEEDSGETESSEAHDEAGRLREEMRKNKIEARELARQIRQMQKQTASCDRERELLQQEQNRIVLTNLRLEDSCRELRAANSQINKVSLADSEADRQLTEKLRDSLVSIQRELSELGEKSEVLQREREEQLEAFKGLLGEQQRLETEVTTREADMNKREAALHEIDPDVGILFKQCEMMRLQGEIDKKRVQLLHEEETHLKKQLESGKTKFKEVLESIRAGEQMAQRLGGEAVLCQQAVHSLRVDFERNQQHLNRLRTVAEQHSKEFDQLDELRELLAKHESQLAERARTLQKIRIQRGAASAAAATAQNGSK